MDDVSQVYKNTRTGKKNVHGHIWIQKKHMVAAKLQTLRLQVPKPMGEITVAVYIHSVYLEHSKLALYVAKCVEGCSN